MLLRFLLTFRRLYLHHPCPASAVPLSWAFAIFSNSFIITLFLLYTARILPKAKLYCVSQRQVYKQPAIADRAIVLDHQGDEFDVPELNEDFRMLSFKGFVALLFLLYSISVFVDSTPNPFSFVCSYHHGMLRMIIKRNETRQLPATFGWVAWQRCSRRRSSGNGLAAQAQQDAFHHRSRPRWLGWSEGGRRLPQALAQHRRLLDERRARGKAELRKGSHSSREQCPFQSRHSGSLALVDWWSRGYPEEASTRVRKVLDEGRANHGN